MQPYRSPAQAHFAQCLEAACVRIVNSQQDRTPPAGLATLTVPGPDWNHIEAVAKISIVSLDFELLKASVAPSTGGTFQPTQLSTRLSGS